MNKTTTHERHRTIDTSNLRMLNRMDDFKVAQGNPDPRGWDVIAKDGKKIGKVEHLLVDPSARMVRYLGVDLDRSLRGDLMGDRAAGDHVLVPVDTARLSSQNREQVFIPETSSGLAALPVYNKSSIASLLGPDRDRTDRGRPAGPREERLGEGGERRITLAEEELALGKRTVMGGEVGIEKKVETEHVRKTVPVTREEVTIERRPVTGSVTGMDTSPRIHEDEIRIPLTHEEVVVEKRAVPKEELVVKKHQVTGEERIDETVRKERLEVHGEENVKEVGRQSRR